MTVQTVDDFFAVLAELREAGLGGAVIIDSSGNYLSEYSYPVQESDRYSGMPVVIMGFWYAADPYETKGG